jgi:hypothetical protein
MPPHVLLATLSGLATIDQHVDDPASTGAPVCPVGVEKTGRSAVRFGWQILRGDEPCVEGTVIHVSTGGRGAPWLEGLRSGRPSTA